MLARLPCLTLLLCPLVVACHDDKTFDPDQVVSIDTRVDPGQVAAGVAAAVTCVRLNGHGDVIDGGQFVVGVDPLAQSFVEGSSVSSFVAGAHAVTCSDGTSGLIDDTPAQLMVLAGPAVSTRLTLTPSQVGAGAPSTAVCEALDAHGNVANAELSLSADPSDSVTITGTTSVSATHVGSYEITCGATGIDDGQRGKQTLTVIPGPPGGITLKFTPDLTVYSKGQAVLVEGQVTDQFGNIREGEIVPVTDIAGTPGGTFEIVGDGHNRIRFSVEDRYVVSATSAVDADQSATRPLVVDETKPVLVLDSPPRAVVTDTLQTITVAGTVSDNLGQIDYLRIAGQDMPLPLAGGHFSYDIPLQYGLTLLDIRTADTQGFETMISRAVEQGLGGYYPMLERTFAADGIKNAAAIVLTQDAFDDGDHDEAARDDLASIIETVIKNLDFVALAPKPLASFSCINGNCTLELTNVRMDDVNVAMQLQNGKIHLDIELINFEGEMTLFFPCDTAVICPQRPVSAFPVTFHADRVHLVTDFLVAVSGGTTTATAENTVVTVEGFTAHIDNSADQFGILNGLLTGFVELVRDYLVGFMEAFMTDLVQDQIGGALQGLFDALSLDQTFDIPAFVEGQPPNTLVIQTQPAGVDIAPERLQLRVDALAYAQNPVRPHDHLGSLRHSGCSPERALQFPPPSPITVGLHDDLINELLFAIWDGGTINLNLSGDAADALLSDFGLLGAVIKVDALLPPVFESCDGQNKAQLGELNLDITADFAGETTHISLWLLAEAPFDLKFETNADGALEARLALDSVTPLHIEVVTNTGLFEGNDDAVVSLVRDTVIPQLLGTVTDAAKFPLPSIDLGALTGTGSGPTINLDIQAVARDNAYLTINGALK